MYGHMGRILVVNLTDSRITTLPVDPEVARRFMGGSGYASRLLYDLLDSKADPLSAGNNLFFMTGPLTGTQAPCTGRHVICGRSPLTGIWGESHCGGHFGARLKHSGFDGILVRGRAERPTVLSVNNGRAELLPAGHLWGLKTGEVEERLRRDLGPVQVASIGPAGENLVRFASIVTNERVAARCGLGAVMGSKKLKAIAVQGSQRVPLADPTTFTELARSSFKTLGEVMGLLRDSGTALYVEVGLMFNDMPIKYFEEVEFEADSISAKAMKRILTGRSACYSCPIACGRRVTVPDQGLVDIAGPEYQTIAAFGSNLMIPDLNKIALMNWLCNQYGMDTVSCGSTIAFATHLCDIGLLGVGLSWGDADRVIQTIHMIASREGAGDDLADGSRVLAARTGTEDLAIHVKGLEVPNHDPRAFAGMATVYAVASRGATHLEGDMYSVDMGADVQELGIVSGDRLENEGKGRTAAMSQEYRAFFDSMIMCHFAIVPLPTQIQLLNAALGTSLQTADIQRIGSRAVNMKRMFNLRCGLTPADDRLPSALMRPQAEDVTEGFVPDLGRQLKEYYEYRHWDYSTGKPSADAIADLGVDS